MLTENQWGEMSMDWTDQQFTELTTMELYQIYRLRTVVFNDEQNSSYPDPDEQDLKCHHVLGMQDGQLVAYARYFVDGDHVTFGRVVTAKEFRGRGIGEQLINHVLAGIQQHFPGRKIVIHAQAYVEDFYRHFGFQPEGEYFIEADRKHIQMRLTPASKEA